MNSCRADSEHERNIRRWYEKGVSPAIGRSAGSRLLTFSGSENFAKASTWHGRPVLGSLHCCSPCIAPSLPIPLEAAAVTTAPAPLPLASGARAASRSALEGRPHVLCFGRLAERGESFCYSCRRRGDDHRSYALPMKTSSLSGIIDVSPVNLSLMAFAAADASPPDS